MAKKKLIPEYQFTLGSESKIEQSTIRNIYDTITDAEKATYGRISGVRLSQNNNGLTSSEVARNFLRKNIDDTVTGEHSYTKGIKTDNYIAGIDGIGYKLYKDENGYGNLEVDNINVRQAIHTTILTYDKVNAIGGTMVLSSAWATIDKVEQAGTGESHRIKCYYKPEGIGLQSWAVDDQVRLQSGIDKFLLTIVTDVSEAADSDGYFWVELYHGEDYTNGLIAGSTIPQVGDTIVQWGHRGAFDERKSIIIMSVGSGTDTYPYIEQYAGVTSFDLTSKLVTRISNDVYFGEADKSKYLWWNKEGNSQFLLKGTLNQSPSDETFPSPVFRGAWNNIEIFYKGDVVTHLGSSWIAVSEMPMHDVEPPSPGEWAVYSQAGTDGANGTDGTDGVDGGNTAVLYLYKRSATAPTYDGGAGVTYNFSLKAITEGSTGTWSQTIPSGTNPLYVITAVAYSNIGVADVYYADFTSPVLFVENGVDGDNGEVGMSVRYTNWKAGVHYFAGNITDVVGGETNTRKYIDYVTFVPQDGILRAYKCLTAHDSSYYEPEDHTDARWEVVSYIPVIASDLVLANQAVIGGFVFSSAVDASGNNVSPSAQYLRTTDSPTTPAIKLSGDGTGHLAKGNIAWDAAGNIDMEGALNAGSIGGFEISGGRIGRQLNIDAAGEWLTSTYYYSGDTVIYNDEIYLAIATSYSVPPPNATYWELIADGMSIYDEYIRFANSEASAFIGTNVNPNTATTKIVARFINRRQSSPLYYNYGIVTEATGAGYNIGLKSTGEIVCNTASFDYGVRFVSPSINQAVVMSAVWAEGFKKVFVTFTATNSSIVLPTIGHVRSRLGISSTTTFAIPITIICGAASTQNGKVRGKSSDIGGLNTSAYPILYDSNGVELGTGIAFGKGDVYQYMLVYDSSTYAAYTINLSNQ